MRDTYDLTSQNLNSQKQMRKQQLQVCKSCFNKYFSNHLKYEK